MGEWAKFIRQKTPSSAAVHEVHKYKAETYRLKARIALATNDFDTASKEFAAALTQACEAFTRANEIVQMVASNVADERLRTTFLSSTAVREVIAGADHHAAQ